jgi:hypothetical protein
MALAAAFASLIGSCKMKFYFKDCHQEIPTSKDCWIVEYEVLWSPCQKIIYAVDVSQVVHKNID